MHLRMCIQNIFYNSNTICLISFAQKFVFVLYILIKGKHYHSLLLVENAFIWGILKVS
jgi:hypothetical protein